jgi:hypothetical protein
MLHLNWEWVRIIWYSAHAPVEVTTPAKERYGAKKDKERD